jgi:hypothetical protein
MIVGADLLLQISSSVAAAVLVVELGLHDLALLVLNFQ